MKIQHASGVDLTPDVVWILAVGSDARPGEDMTHTRGDALQLIGINTVTGAAAAIGVPRDSWVPIPGVGSNRINASLYYGGPQLLGQTVGDLVGIQPDYVFVTRFPFFIAHGQGHRRHRRRQPGRLRRHLPQAERLQGRPDPPQRLRRDGVLPDPARPAAGRLRPLGQPAAGAARHPGQGPGPGRPGRASWSVACCRSWRTCTPTCRRPSCSRWPRRWPRSTRARSPTACSRAGSATSAAPASCCPSPTRPRGWATGPARTPRSSRCS